MTFVYLFIVLGVVPKQTSEISTQREKFEYSECDCFKDRVQVFHIDTESSEAGVN